MFFIQLPYAFSMKVPLIAVVLVWSIERSSMPSPCTGTPFTHHACGDLPDAMFGNRIAGDMPIVHGPEPEMEVTITGCCWPLPARPFNEPPSRLQTPEAWHM